MSAPSPVNDFFGHPQKTAIQAGSDAATLYRSLYTSNKRAALNGAERIINSQCPRDFLTLASASFNAQVFRSAVACIRFYGSQQQIAIVTREVIDRQAATTKLDPLTPSLSAAMQPAYAKSG
jgi:hypothetical protein